MLEVIQDNSIDDFLAQAGPLLYKDEPTNSLMLGLCLAATRAAPKEPPVLMRIVSDGQTVTAAVQTPPRNLIISYAKPDELELLAKTLKEKGIGFPGVVGPAQESEIFASIWSRMTGKKAKLAMGQKIYKIEKVMLPKVEGELRLARPDEASLIAQWLVEFGDESLPPHERVSFDECLPRSVRAIENGYPHLWVVDTKPVSMAHISRPTQNGISVAAVYTPKALRKRGYASAVVAHLSQKMLDSGRQFCVLYTDLSNPTSNKIYQDIGYKEVSDSKFFLFEG